MSEYRMVIVIVIHEIRVRRSYVVNAVGSMFEMFGSAWLYIIALIGSKLIYSMLEFDSVRHLLGGGFHKNFTLAWGPWSKLTCAYFFNWVAESINTFTMCFGCLLINQGQQSVSQSSVVGRPSPFPGARWINRWFDRTTSNTHTLSLQIFSLADVFIYIYISSKC